MKDPTRSEMLEYLATIDMDPDDFDKEEAMYWFAYNWHSGQSSNLYSVLSSSKFKPGSCSNGPQSDGMGKYLYDELEEHFS